MEHNLKYQRKREEKEDRERRERVRRAQESREKARKVCTRRMFVSQSWKYWRQLFNRFVGYYQITFDPDFHLIPNRKLKIPIAYSASQIDVLNVRFPEKSFFSLR